MTDVKKVREELQDVVNEYGMDYYVDNHFPLTINALTELERLQKKEVPMKPKIFTQEKGYKIEICPSCKGSIHALKHWHEINGRGTYCDLCGQKLDWSDEK